MADHNDLGKIGESIALSYLIDNQYSILHQNYRIQKAEFDFIVKKNQVLIFVEVKTRASKEDLAEWSVTKAKQRILFQGAEMFKEKIKFLGECSFDVISIQWIPNHKPEIYHIKDAFYDPEY
jgi:putative endonuclease